MADTTFISKVTQIATGWLQDLNNFFYRHTGFTSKATPVDADTWYLWDSVASAWKTLSLANLKAACSAGWNAYTATNQSGGTVAATTISASGLITATGGQIKFPATQVPSSDANTLDDYEEGTFTPAISGTSTAGTGSYSPPPVGRYVKVGALVHFTVELLWSSHTGTGNMTITGLPFASATDTAVAIGWFNNITTPASTIPLAQVPGGQTYVYLTTFPIGGGASAALALDTSGGILVSGSYRV